MVRVIWGEGLYNDWSRLALTPPEVRVVKDTWQEEIIAGRTIRKFESNYYLL